VCTWVYIHIQSLELQQARDAAAAAKESFATSEGDREQEVSLSVCLSIYCACISVCNACMSASTPGSASISTTHEFSF
jgi:hypothetical protein